MHSCPVSEFKEAQRNLGERIRDARKAKGWTQEDLAYEAEIDRSYIGGVERGERNISFSMLCRLAQALERDIASFTYQLPE